MILRISGALAAVLVTALALPARAETRSVPPQAGALVIAQATTDGAAPRRSRKRSETGPKKEPTASQMAARERQRKCAADWKSAKAGGKIEAGMKWPKFWSQCNARLKGNNA